MLSIKNNIMAANTARHLGRAYDNLAKSVERLSSGLRVNSGKDDAAGLAFRELIRADIRVLQQGARNAQDGISMVQTMEGAMAVMDENLVRMKELAEQAATGTYSAAQRVIMNNEFVEMADEIERIANTTTFNGVTMLNAAPTATNAVAIHVGSATTIDIDTVNMTKAGLNLTGETWEVSGLTANGVASASDTWLTVAQTQSSGAATSVTLTISFEDNDTPANDELDIEVALTVSTSGSTTFSLADIVSQINTASNALGVDANGNSLNYSAASTSLDTTSGQYVLQLNSRESTSDEHTISISGIYTESAAGNISGGFNITAVEATTGASVAVSDDMGAGATDLGLNILTTAAATSAFDTITSAINTKDTARAAFGYKMNRLESTVGVVNIQAENLAAAESRISDVDVATEMATLTRVQVLSQAGVAMLAQANSMPQLALTLLRG